MSSINEFASAKLAQLDSMNLRRTLTPSWRQNGIWIERHGQKLLSFSCNDYLNLSHHPKVIVAAQAAIEHFGAGAGASRLVTGNYPLYDELEARLAAVKKTQAACVFGSGYLTNIGTIPIFAGQGDAIFIDELAHACLFAGAKLSEANVYQFRHNDVEHLTDLLALHRHKFARTLIVTETVFSMDGDLGKIADLRVLADRFDAWLLTDDAHGLGVVENLGMADLQMGTLSKAVGGYGGYVCACRPVIDLIKTRARSLIYTTGLPPATVAGAIAALDIMAGDPELCRKPVMKARLFSEQAGLGPAFSPIVPILIGSAATTLTASRELADEGYLVTAIRPPTVPADTARLRVALTAGHPDSAIAALAGLVRKYTVRQ